MAVKKGLTALVNSSPNFSNQALENSINTLKIGWVTKSIELDTAITNNSVLTTSQKNDVKDTVNNIAYLNAGRYLNDMVRHTNSILDGTILGVTPGIEDFPQGDFLEIMQLIVSLQTTIPDLYGVPASAKGKSVDDHLGILNNKFSKSQNNARPVFETLRESIQFINNANLSTETALITAIDDLKNFLATVAADSTDFQQSLNNRASAVATANSNFDGALQSQPYSVKRTQMIADRDSIVTQKDKENTNITTLRSYADSVSDYLAYVSLADDDDMRKVMSTVSQNANWRTYFENYTDNQDNLNPAYTISTDSDKAAIIDQILVDSGLPDVTDSTDLQAVADKAKRDSRVDTKGYDRLTVEQQITESCRQLNLEVSNRNINDQSRRLLNNMNQHDRDTIATQLDLNESTDTLS